MAEAGKTLHLEVITPDAAVLHEDVDFILVRALDGDLGIMPNHAPLIASLSIWPLYYDKDGKRDCVTVAGGLHGSPQQCGYGHYAGFGKAGRHRYRPCYRIGKACRSLLAEHAANLDETRARASLERALRRIDVARKYGKH